MNERIKELAEQASLYAVSDNSSMLFDVWKKRYTEKFAELIVKDCLEQVRDEVQYEYDWKLADAVTKRVMEHFGVEE